MIKVTFEDDTVVLEQQGPDNKLVAPRRYIEVPYTELPALAATLHQEGADFVRVKVAGWRVIARLLWAQVKAMVGK